MVGGIVFGSIGVGAATYFSASQVSYTPSDETWNVTSVEEAINDLYTQTSNSSGSIYYLGTSSSYDIKELYPDIDYTKLTKDNFICAVSSVYSNGSSFYSDKTFATLVSGIEGCIAYATVTSFSMSPTISYSNSTGVVTISGISTSVVGGVEKYFNSTDVLNVSASVSANIKVYMVISDIQ